MANHSDRELLEYAYREQGWKEDEAHKLRAERDVLRAALASAPEMDMTFGPAPMMNNQKMVDWCRGYMKWRRDALELVGDTTQPEVTGGIQGEGE